MSKHKVIYDTDPGVDDAMALVFQALHPDIELLGLTSVFGNATIETTTRNARFLAGRFAAGVPVAQGAAAPLKRAAPEPLALDSRRQRARQHRAATQTVAGAARRAARASLHHRHGARASRRSHAARGGPADEPRVGARRRSADRVARQAGGDHGRRVRHGRRARQRDARGGGQHPRRPRCGRHRARRGVAGCDRRARRHAAHHHEPATIWRRCASAAARPASSCGMCRGTTRRFTSKARNLQGIYVHDSSAVAYVLAPHLYTTRSGPVRVLTEGIAVGQTIQKPSTMPVPAPDWDSRPDCKVCVGVDVAGHAGALRAHHLRHALRVV